MIAEHLSSIKASELERETLRMALTALQINIDKEHLNQIIEKAFVHTQKDTHQAMEGFIHNLNTMHSRGGNQAVSYTHLDVYKRQECKEFMQEVNNAGSKLPIIDITQYTCTVQI